MPSDPSAAFDTHSNYILAFDTLIEARYAPVANPLQVSTNEDVLLGIADAVRASGTFMRLGRSRCDNGVVRTILTNAWGTELLLALNGVFAPEELAGLANHWGVVQAYYACYHAAQALAVAKGEARPGTHVGTLRWFASSWVKRGVELPPWSIGFARRECRNLPPGQTIQERHQWEVCTYESCWDLAVMALRTTRNDYMRETLFPAERKRKRNARSQAWDEEERQRLPEGRRRRARPLFKLPRLSNAEKSRIDDRLQPTTMLDYLYRLRTRSNYEDAQMFVDGPSAPESSERVHRNLCRLTSSTLLVHELHIGRLVGRKEFTGWMDSWLENPATQAARAGLQERRVILVEGLASA